MGSQWSIDSSTSAGIEKTDQLVSELLMHAGARNKVHVMLNITFLDIEQYVSAVQYLRPNYEEPHRSSFENRNGIMRTYFDSDEIPCGVICLAYAADVATTPRVIDYEPKAYDQQAILQTLTFDPNDIELPEDLGPF